MAYENQQLCIGTLTAAADLSTKQYYFVKLASATTVAVCSGVTDKPIGVLQNAPGSGETAEVCFFGVSKVVADQALAAGDIIATSADGQADTPPAGATTYVAGQAITAVSNAGEVATAFINIGNSLFT